MTEFSEKLYYVEVGYIKTGEPYDSADCPARDSRTVSYDQGKCSAGKEQRHAIADAVHKFFQASYDVDPDHLEIHFSDELDDNEIGLGNIQAKGIKLSVAPHIEMFSDAGVKTFSTIYPFNNENGLKKFKTVKTDNSYFSARTWEDVAKGLNEQLKRLGQADIQIDTALFIRK